MPSLFGFRSGTVLSQQEPPVAKIVADPEIGILGTIVRLDGSPSVSPGDIPLTYSWRFVAVPIGSMVPQEGFRKIDDDYSLVSFSPDLTGEYLVELVVSNALYSSSATSRITVRAILIPDGRGIIPDGKFIWSYIRDVWQGVENKEVFESLWSLLIQITGAQMLRLYQSDFNKSIRDIQDQYQRRWLSYEPKLVLDPETVTAYVGGEAAGKDASTVILGQTGKAIILSKNELIVIQGSVILDAVGPVDILYSRNDDNVGAFDLLGPNSSASGYRLNGPFLDEEADRVVYPLRPQFEFQSKVWSLGIAPSKSYGLKMSMFPHLADELLPLFSFDSGKNIDIRPGDVIHMKTGSNQGFYRIMKVTGAYIEVDRAPPSLSSSSDDAAVYRPVGFKLPPVNRVISNTFAIPYTAYSAPLLDAEPGRLITVGGRAYTILRTYLDDRQLVPSIIVVTEGGEVITGRTGLDWRLANTLYSETLDFEALGVSVGDTIVFDVTAAGSGGKTDLTVGGSRVALNAAEQSVEVPLQVVAVEGHRLGFIIELNQAKAGVPYEVSDLMFAYLFQSLKIPSVVISRNEISLAGNARELYNYLHANQFRSTYWHRPLTSKTKFETPIGTFEIRPKHIIRNSKIPVPDEVLSIPALQEWISQPQTIVKDGIVYQVRGDKTYPLARKPVVLTGNNDYIVDSQIALEDTLVFKTGSKVFELENASFVDRRIEPGDILTIQTNPAIAGDYIIADVIDAHRLLLSKPIPKSLGDGLVSATVTITRRSAGRFLRIIPGTFKAANPLPDRLWAEVTYFDNRDTVEKNFGILVGLTRARLESVSRRVSYRQAVAGLMYAYTSGASVDKIRLGAQILLGLPFAEHRGRIRAIDPDYRLDVRGNPLYGRLLVEDVDDVGESLGTQRIYTYPVDQISDLAGVDTNPETGVPYKVGDIVELFAPLAKGVTVDDYISNPTDTLLDGKLMLQKYHSFRLRANDMIFDLKEIELVSEFLKRITPSYVAFMLTEVTEVSDILALTDATTVRLKQVGLGLTDNIATAIQTPFAYDETNYNGRPELFWELGATKRRKSGAAEFTIGSRVVSVPEGGLLVDPSVDGPPVKVGDIFIGISGAWTGFYRIEAVTDNTVTLNGTAPPTGFSDDPGVYELVSDGSRWSATDFERAKKNLTEGEVLIITDDEAYPELTVVDTGRYGGTFAIEPVLPKGTYHVRSKIRPLFMIVRKVLPVVRDGVIESISGSTVVVETGLVTDGVMPGDWLVSGGKRFEISNVREEVAGENSWKVLDFLSAPDVTVGAAYRIYRPQYIPDPYEDEVGILSSDGTAYTHLDNPYVAALMETLDQFAVDELGYPELTIIDPDNLTITPVLPAGDYPVVLRKRKSAAAPQGFDYLDGHSVIEDIGLRVDVTTPISGSAGSTTISLGSGFAVSPKRGDVLEFVGKSYPISAVLPDSQSVVLSRPLTDTGPAAWALLRRL